MPSAQKLDERRVKVSEPILNRVESKVLAVLWRTIGTNSSRERCAGDREWTEQEKRIDNATTTPGQKKEQYKSPKSFVETWTIRLCRGRVSMPALFIRLNTKFGQSSMSFVKLHDPITAVNVYAITLSILKIYTCSKYSYMTKCSTIQSTSKTSNLPREGLPNWNVTIISIRVNSTLDY